MNSRPGSTCSKFGHFTERPALVNLLKGFCHFSRPSFEVRGSASLSLLATSTMVRAYLKTLRREEVCHVAKKERPLGEPRWGQ